jgi:hypothetical protein
VRNQLGHLEDHIGALSVLLGLAVNLEPESDLVDGGKLGLFDERSDGGPGVEALGRGPGEALFLQFFLPVAAGDVDAQRWEDISAGLEGRGV